MYGQIFTQIISINSELDAQMLLLNIFFLPLLFTNSFELKSLFFIPGFQNSPLYATITKAELYPECPDSINHKFIDINSNSKCTTKIIQAHVNEKTGKVEHLPEIKIESSDFGDYNSLNFSSKLISKLINLGYKENKNLFGIGYDWTLFPFGVEKTFSQLKNTIEEVYKTNEEKSILLGHDLGSQFILNYILNYVDQTWAQKYIDSVIFIAPTIGGTLIPKHLNEKSIMNIPSFHMLLPNYIVYDKEPIITKMYDDFDSYNASTIINFLKDNQIIDDKIEPIYKLINDKYHRLPIQEPSIPSFIIYNDAIKTPSKYTITINEDSSKSSVLTPLNFSGDGQISSKGAQYLCENWKSSKCFNINQPNSETGDHFSMLSTSIVIDRIIDYIINNKSTTKEKPKKAFFISPGFSASPLFATVTDPKKVLMCPSKMKFHQFFYPILDGKNRSKLGDECVSMLTRAFLNDDHVDYMPGVYIESSKFGDNEQLISLRSIITRAYEHNYTHYKDLFGIGYNFMMHPLMSDKIYSQLKNHIEKYYEETGMKSVIAGHSQGSSFMHIFITHYVSKEWAMKYVDRVIFLAPAFAGWATYWRLIEGKFSYQMPDNSEEFHKSVSTMPGLHIMLPNEVVFGNKTVIKNFPKEGEMANSSSASLLLKKLNRMDDTSFKIFKLTDKYRKNTLIEPPVQSLVIYNDNVSTPILYNYNPQNNTVTSIFGPGDRVVSDDGPKFACQNWKNVKCINFHNNFDHSKMLNEKQLIDAIFDFINENNDIEANKNSKVSKELNQNNITFKLNINNDDEKNVVTKSKFILFINIGILVVSIIITYAILGFLCFNLIQYTNDKKKKPHLTL